MKATKVGYMGRPCEKHPDLGGLRYKKNGTCIGCIRDHADERKRRVEAYPALLEEVEALRALSSGDAVYVLNSYREKLSAMATRAHAAELELEEKRGALRRLQTLGNAVLKIGRRVRADGHEAGEYPGHSHTKPGHWDSTGKPCVECHEWAHMLKLAKQK